MPSHLGWSSPGHIGSGHKMHRNTGGRYPIQNMASDGKPAPAAQKTKLRNVMPLVWELARPRRGLLAMGFVLMAINRVASLVLPYSTRFLIDSVIIKRHT